MQEIAEAEATGAKLSDRRAYSIGIHSGNHAEANLIDVINRFLPTPHREKMKDDGKVRYVSDDSPYTVTVDAIGGYVRISEAGFRSSRKGKRSYVDVSGDHLERIENTKEYERMTHFNIIGYYE